jgi:CheY-like chemotaxis protein
MTKILVVEDSHLIREMVEEILKGLGYEVEAAENGLEGLEKWHGSEFDAVISDIDMPVMGGEEMFTKMLEHDPNVKLMFATGSTPSVEGYHSIVSKPFDVYQLQVMVEDLVSQKINA